MKGSADFEGTVASVVGIHTEDSSQFGITLPKFLRVVVRSGISKGDVLKSCSRSY